jgi:hypothetical protein
MITVVSIHTSEKFRIGARCMMPQQYGSELGVSRLLRGQTTQTENTHVQHHSLQQTGEATKRFEIF